MDLTDVELLKAVESSIKISDEFKEYSKQRKSNLIKELKYFKNFHCDNEEERLIVSKCIDLVETKTT